MESSIKFDRVSILNDEDIYIKFSSDINTVAWYTFTLRKKESLEVSLLFYIGTTFDSVAIKRERHVMYSARKPNILCQ